ncbi:MAG: ankyrin repeat domain-containing protein [Candidatus Babeliales bacterium]
MEHTKKHVWFNAILENNLPEVEMLIEQGIDVNTQNSDGQTALHLAAQQAHDELVYVLIISKMNVHIKDNRGNNALHVAALNGHQVIMQSLIDYGVDAELVKHMDIALDLLALNNNGKTARMLALEHGHTEIAQILQQEEWGTAIAKNDIEQVKMLLQEVISEDMKDFGLRVAVRWKHIEIIKLFLVSGFDTNIKNHFGETAFYEVITSGNTTLIELFLNHGADVHVKTTQGETVLHCAVRCGHKEIAELLIEHGVDMHIPTRREETLLHIACKYGHIGIVEWLLHCNINVNARNRSNETALDCVLDRFSNEEHFDKIADLLRAHGAQEQKGL